RAAYRTKSIATELAFLQRHSADRTPSSLGRSLLARHRPSLSPAQDSCDPAKLADDAGQQCFGRAAGRRESFACDPATTNSPVEQKRANATKSRRVIWQPHIHEGPASAASKEARAKACPMQRSASTVARCRR